MESLRTLHKARFTDVLDYGIHLFKKHFRSIFIINLIFNIPIQVLLAIINPVFSNQYLSMFDISSGMASSSPSAMFSSILTLYTMLFGVLALYGLNTLTLQNIWEGSIIKLLYSDVVLKQERSIRQVVSECFKQFWSLLGGRFLYGLIQYGIVTVLYFVIIILILLGTFSVAGVVAIGVPWVTVVLIILGILLSLAAVFFITVLTGFFYGRFWMYFPSICIEQKKASNSIGRGGNLGKKSFWLISLTYIAGNLLVWLFPGVINSAFSITGLLSSDFDMSVMRLVMVITQIFASVLQPLIICILTALYITLRVRREGLDMEASLWSIKQEEKDRTQRWMAEAPNAAE
ncbi:MAG: hypothetical protein KBA53_05885 [Thermoclostridium sp.]|nr:hypothetical protein [Thermoclostridium sp.]